ncbi:enoyl-CoA hydratase-related protein [Saccharopolyspora shandongensis]|uniref:enoyl-CoA hydratase-related protein n=1 Tax=Saccharopolyspora shandongensis TaxID=418495 RepID=UPI003400CBA9
MVNELDDGNATYTQILYDVAESVCRITLNRPHLRNAQSLVLLDELVAAFERAAADDSVKVIVLGGAGPAFSSGHDLGSPEDVADRKRRGIVDTFAGRYETYQAAHLEAALRLRRCPKPTIAEVGGYCIYGGFILASAMDVVVADADAKFLPAQLAFFSAPWDFGPRRAKDILYRGSFLSAVEAAEFGFVGHVAEAGGLRTLTQSLAREIADAHTLFELRMLKESVNLAQDQMGYETALRQGYLFYALETAERRDRIGPPKLGEKPRLDGVQKALQKLSAGVSETAVGPLRDHGGEPEMSARAGSSPSPIGFDDVPQLAGRRFRSGGIVVTPGMCTEFEHSTKLRETFPDIIARREPGVQIIEGFLSLGLVDALIGTVLRYDSETLRTLNYGVDRCRFTRPVFAGETVWADIEVLAVRAKNSAFLVDYRCDLKSGSGEGALFAVVNWTVHVSRKADEWVA